MPPLSTATITVLVPTYRRVSDLGRCLEALGRQIRQADEVIVVVRDSDDETTRFLAEARVEGLPLRGVTVSEPGVVAAMNAGLASARCDILAITDDDAAPLPDWLSRIEAHFLSNPCLGGVGGRDFIHHKDRDEDGARRVVGYLQWHGRVIGNHHLGFGASRAVDLLKGVNCAYRTEVLRQIGFDTRLHGVGAQVHWELSLGLALKRRHWELVYDPAVAVHHYPAPRRDPDTNSRGIFHGASHQDTVYNETIILLEHLPPLRRAVFAVWLTFLGTKAEPGLLLLVWLVARRTPHAPARYTATVRGRLEGLHAHLLGGVAEERLARGLQ